MKRKLIVTAILLFASGIFAYLLGFTTIIDPYIVTNRYITSHGWKGGSLEGLPDILDFRSGRMTLRGDVLYLDGEFLGTIVKREYRLDNTSFIEVQSKTGEIHPFWGKWKND